MILFAFTCLGLLMEFPTSSEYNWVSLYTQHTLSTVRIVLYVTQLAWFLSMVWGYVIDHISPFVALCIMFVCGTVNIILWLVLQYIFPYSEIGVVTILTIVEFLPAMSHIFLANFTLLFLDDNELFIRTNRYLIIGKIIGSWSSQFFLTEKVYLENVFQFQSWITFAFMSWIVYAYLNLPVYSKIQDLDAPKNGPSATDRQFLNQFVMYLVIFYAIPSFSFFVLFYITNEQNDSVWLMTFIQSLDYIGEFIGTFIIWRESSVAYISFLYTPLYIVGLCLYYNITQFTGRALYTVIIITTLVFRVIESSLFTTFSYRMNMILSKCTMNQGMIASTYYLLPHVGRLIGSVVSYTCGVYYNLDYQHFDDKVLWISVVFSGLLMVYTLFLFIY